MPFLLRSLRSVLRAPDCRRLWPMRSAIWTHVAGQTTAKAPSPLAFVTAILHGDGSFVPVAGMGSIPLALARAATESGVEFRMATKVSAIRCHAGRAIGVTTAAGEFIEADAVISNSNGVGTYLELVHDDVPASARRQLEGLPAPVARSLCLPGRARWAYPAILAIPSAGKRRALPPAGHTVRRC